MLYSQFAAEDRAIVSLLALRRRHVRSLDGWMLLLCSDIVVSLMLVWGVGEATADNVNKI